MAVKLKYLIILLVLFTSCSGKKLPFYTAADFSPVWLSESDPRNNSLHRINDFSFVNQEGKTISKTDMKNKIYVADFFFTTCPGICPVMNKNMKKVYDKFLNEDDVRILSFTVNPKTDNVAALKEYSEKLGVNDNNGKWNFLTGSKQDLYTTARKSFFADDDTGLPVGESDFIHTEKFILVDNENRIRGVYNGTSDEEIAKLEEDINILKKEIN